MKEVKLGRVAGPFDENPFHNQCYIQSPIGLVPKAGNQTRLIFHLSYNFGIFPEDMSLNYYTPDEDCTISYRDLDYAIRASLYLRLTRNTQNGTGNNEFTLYYSKSDLRSAFRILPVLPVHRRFLLFKAINPLNGKYVFFAEKSLPFGASISCKRFQDFSDSLKHIVEGMSGRSFTITNYLDDFLFVDDSQQGCNNMVRSFLSICEYISCPVALEKTEWATSRIIFLGIMLDGRKFHLSIPIEKVNKALDLLNWAIDKKKVTIKFIQRLTGTLNFLNKAIVPGRAFTRGMYTKLSTCDKNGQKLKQYHHVNLGFEFIQDCLVWKNFLTNKDIQEVVCRPFIDIDLYSDTITLNLYTDASLNSRLGCGGIFNDRWFILRWNQRFIQECKPSIAFLELYAVVAAIFVWGHLPNFQNCRLAVYCDNDAVKHMINGYVSRCHQSRKLLRILALDCLYSNRRVFVRHIKTDLNVLADSLSRFQFDRFWKHAPGKYEKDS